MYDGMKFFDFSEGCVLYLAVVKLSPKLVYLVSLVKTLIGRLIMYIC